MSSDELQRQRQQLRQALLMQREAVDQALGNVYTPPPAPRSRTMRFLHKNPAVAHLLGRSLKLFIATRLLR